MGRIVAWYDYTDHKGNLLFRKVRREPGHRGRSKSLDWLTFTGYDDDGDMTFLNHVTEDRREDWHSILYRLPEVVAALRVDATLLICEGEKDTDTADRVLGMTATSASNPTAPRIEQAEWFVKYNSRSEVLIAADQDVPGAKAAWGWYQNLLTVGVDASRLTVITPKRRRHNDVTDVLEAGRGLDGFRVVDLDRLERAATQYAPRGGSPGGSSGPLDGDEYEGLAFEPGYGWFNPDADDYLILSDPAIRNWRPTLVERS